MKQLKDYLDELKEQTGSDYKTAAMLNVTRTAISLIRKRGETSDETAIKIAEALKVKPEQVLIAAAFGRSKDPKTKKQWEKIAYRLRCVAMIILTLNTGTYGGGMRGTANLPQYTLYEAIRRRFNFA